MRRQWLSPCLLVLTVLAISFVWVAPAVGQTGDEVQNGPDSSTADPAKTAKKNDLGIGTTSAEQEAELPPAFLVLDDDGNSIPADPATEPDPSRGTSGAAAATVADDLEPPCVAREGGSGSAAGDAGSLSADELAARGIESPEATQNHLDAVIQAQAGADTSSTDDGSAGGGASSRAGGEGLKDMTYMPVVVAAKPVKSASFWQDGDAESAPSTLESNTAAVLDIWRDNRQEEAADNDFDTSSESVGDDESDCVEFDCTANASKTTDSLCHDPGRDIRRGRLRAFAPNRG